MENKRFEGSAKYVLNAKDTIQFNDVTVAGEKAASSNAKILFDCANLEINGATIENGSTVYNVFEQRNTVSKFNIKSVQAKDITCLNNSLTHNVLNVYNLATGANILVEDSEFELNVDNSNVLRLTNYLNADNVTVTFKNVNWNYTAGSDFGWAGLAIYQAVGSDALALETPDLSHIKTWKFIFDNCKYNGTKVTANNFGENNQVLYFYNVSKAGELTDPAELGVRIEFK